LWWWEELSEGSSVPQCVLTELGRMEDEAVFGEAVWWYWYSGRDLSAKQAAETLKRMRTGKTSEEGPITLYRRLMRTVEDFRRTYPGASVRYQEDQVELVLRTVSLARR
jgi:hypothetical protein